MKLASKSHIIKEVEVLRRLVKVMGNMGVCHSTLIRIASSFIIIILLSPVSNAEVRDYSKGWDGDITVEGGRTIIVEELSTTWCVSCAEIDPYLQQVADAHGSRITIVTYHPTDGDDAFQPEAAKERIDRMRLINPQIGQTPTFVVESGLLRVGPDSWPDVQKDILKEETNRQETSQLSFSVSKFGDNYTAKIENLSLISADYETQLTFMMMAHDLPVPEGYINPGEATRDRVVTAIASCKLGNNTINNTGFTQASGTLCSSDFSVNFSPEGKFSIVLIHEATESSLKENSDTAKTLGLVEFAFRDIQIQSQVNIMPLVFFSVGLIGIIWVAYDKFNAVKNRKAS